MITVQAVYGWDRHIWDVPLQGIEIQLQIAFSAKLLFLVAGFSVRMALYAFYYRLVTNVNVRWFKWLLHAGVFFHISTLLTLSSLTIFLCT